MKSCIRLSILSLAMVSLWSAPERLHFAQVGSALTRVAAYQTVFRLSNEQRDTSSAILTLFSADGSAMDGDLEAQWSGIEGSVVRNGNQFELAVPAEGAVELTLTASTTHQLGWAQLEKPLGLVVQSFFQFAKGDFSDGVPLFEDHLTHEVENHPTLGMNQFSFPYRFTRGNQELSTALALVNLSARTTEVELLARDGGRKVVELGPGELRSFYAHALWPPPPIEIFPLRVYDIVEVRSPAPLAASVYRTLNGFPLSGVLGSEKPISPNQVIPALESDFELALGESAELETGQTITFWNLEEDSRCPQGAICIWEGQARVALRVQTPGVPSSDLGLIDRAGNRDLATGTIGGLLIELLGVDPYPDLATHVTATDYRIRLRVKSVPE